MDPTTQERVYKLLQSDFPIDTDNDENDGDDDEYGFYVVSKSSNQRQEDLKITCSECDRENKNRNSDVDSSSILEETVPTITSTIVETIPSISISNTLFAVAAIAAPIVVASISFNRKRRRRMRNDNINIRGNTKEEPIATKSNINDENKFRVAEVIVNKEMKRNRISAISKQQHQQETQAKKQGHKQKMTTSTQSRKRSSKNSKSQSSFNLKTNDDDGESLSEPNLVFEDEVEKRTHLANYYGSKKPLTTRRTLSIKNFQEKLITKPSQQQQSIVINKNMVPNLDLHEIQNFVKEAEEVAITTKSVQAIFQHYGVDDSNNGKSTFDYAYDYVMKRKQESNYYRYKDNTRSRKEQIELQKEINNQSRHDDAINFNLGIYDTQWRDRIHAIYKECFIALGYGLLLSCIVSTLVSGYTLITTRNTASIVNGCNDNDAPSIFDVLCGKCADSKVAIAANTTTTRTKTYYDYLISMSPLSSWYPYNIQASFESMISKVSNSYVVCILKYAEYAVLSLLVHKLCDFWYTPHLFHSIVNIITLYYMFYNAMYCLYNYFIISSILNDDIGTNNNNLLSIFLSLSSSSLMQKLLKFCIGVGSLASLITTKVYSIVLESIEKETKQNNKKYSMNCCSARGNDEKACSINNDIPRIPKSYVDEKLKMLERIRYAIFCMPAVLILLLDFFVLRVASWSDGSYN